MKMLKQIKVVSMTAIAWCVGTGVAHSQYAGAQGGFPDGLVGTGENLVDLIRDMVPFFIIASIFFAVVMLIRKNFGAMAFAFIAAFMASQADNIVLFAQSAG